MKQRTKRMLAVSWVAFPCIALAAAAGPLDPDPGYGVQGRVTFSTGQPEGSVDRSVVQADGKLIVTGTRVLRRYSGYSRSELFARRFLADGTADAAFGTGGELRFAVRGADAINAIALQPDGRILFAVAAAEPCNAVTIGVCVNDAGQSVFPTSALVRLRTDGTFDPTFGGNGIVQVQDFYGGYAVAVQPDGKLLLLGSTSITIARILNWMLARFNSDGSRDAAFNQGRSVTSRCNSFGYALALQADGRIIVGGDDGAFYGDSSANPGFCIERLFADGTPDPGFNQGRLRTNFGINVTLAALALLPDGRLLAWGRGIRVDSSTQPSTYAAGPLAARYSAEGVPDTTYGTGGTWFVPVADFYWVADFTFARDGGLVAAGYEYPSPPPGAPQQYRTALVKVGPNGQPDPAFGSGGIAREAFGANRVAGYLRDVEDRWLLVSNTVLPDANAGGLIERRLGERPQPTPVIEFFNVNLGHYFITASAAEAAGIDAGAAGPGWQRTGQVMAAWQPVAAGTLTGVPQLAQTLCRFYGTPGVGPNSHFYTISPAECALVRNDSGWRFENYAFYAYAPLTAPGGAACPGGLAPVYRVYNNRFAQNDSNHRYTTSQAIYQQMQGQGWIGEGIVFCAGG